MPCRWECRASVQIIALFWTGKKAGHISAMKYAGLLAFLIKNILEPEFYPAMKQFFAKNCLLVY